LQYNKQRDYRVGLRERLTERMDKLQAMMESNHHLEKPEEVIELLDTITFAWTILSEEDRDYVQGCQHAIEDKIEWKL